MTSSSVVTSEKQIIDTDGNFLGGLCVPSECIMSRRYAVLAVIGCQSGGKSTLLNSAFGTSFPVLDASLSGRRRTTLGVWAAIPQPQPQSAPFVVLDVEGSDSRERGEGAKSFESRTALLSLALSDVVIVNMWAHDIGRYSAANYELFETLFAHAARLRNSEDAFMKNKAVQILIVIRDYDGRAAMSDIRRVILGDLENIWAGLKISTLAFEQLFSVTLTTLPHKKYAAEDFKTEVTKLQDSIVSLASGSGLNGESRRRGITQNMKPVPLSGFEALASAVWNAVCDATGGQGPNATFSLDIPRHTALASHFKCSDIVQRMLDCSVKLEVDQLRSEIESEWRSPMGNFSSRINTLAIASFRQYDDEARAYRSLEHGSEAFRSRREDLGMKLVEIITELRECYLWVCRDYCMNGFEDEFRPMLGGTVGYSRTARRLANKYIAKYKSLLTTAQYPSVLRPFVGDYRSNRSRGTHVSSSISTETGPTTSGPETDETSQSPHELVRFDDSDDEDGDQFALERFAKDVHAMVEERGRLGELMLPGGADGANMGNLGPKQTPWWKGLLIRGVILFINFLQATQSHRAALRQQRKQEKEFPPAPTF